MSEENIEKDFSNLSVDSAFCHEYLGLFHNSNKLPIDQVYMERSWRELTPQTTDLDITNVTSKEIENSYFTKKSEILPALDKKWLLKIYWFNFKPYDFTLPFEENVTFLDNNVLFLKGLQHLLRCDYHQFWCTILFENLAVISIRSFLLHPILPFQQQYLEDDCLLLYKQIYSTLILVYDRLVRFKQSEREYMAESYGVSKLVEKKLLNLPIVVTLAILYKDTHLEIVNKICNIYFENPLHLEFFIKEVEDNVDQSFIVLEMARGKLCDSDETDQTTPIAIDDRPPVFSLEWVYSLVTYVFSVATTLNVLFTFYKPSMEVALHQHHPFKLPNLYVTVFREVYELLEGREEAATKADLYEKVLYAVNLAREEFVDLYHVFATYCLDKTLEITGDSVKQQTFVEDYIKLMTTALEEDYFICDYNAAYNVANQNEMFQSCCDIDSTRTEFIVSCINKLPRNKRIEDFLKFEKNDISDLLRSLAPPVMATQNHVDSQPGPSREPLNNGHDVEQEINNILEMFPHLGDGFALQCLEAYNYNTADVIHAILENNLPPHLAEVPFDQIRIPPEPEPEQPILAYKGKKPEYDDALKLLNDKKDIQIIKNLVLEGVQHEYNYLYDDEYDDRFDDVAIRVPDNPLTEELATMNPNRPSKEESSDDSPEEEESSSNKPKNSRDFHVDPAILRERREARFRNKQPQKVGNPSKPPKGDVVGKPKGQGQDKSVLLNRQKKNVRKSSHANHNRKSQSQWKKSGGMFPS